MCTCTSIYVDIYTDIHICMYLCVTHHRISYIIHHTSCIIHHASRILYHTSQIMTYIHIYVCLDVCMYACTSIDVDIYIYIYTYIYVCIYVCMYVCMSTTIWCCRSASLLRPLVTIQRPGESHKNYGSEPKTSELACRTSKTLVLPERSEGQLLASWHLCTEN